MYNSFSSLHILPGSLYIARLAREKIPEVSHALLNVFLFSNLPRFFSFVQTADDVTLVLDGSMLNAFPKDTLTIYGEKWRGLKVILGCCGFNESKIISTLSKILSDSNINIHYLGTYSTDYILIPEQKLRKAILRLRQANVDVSWDDGDRLDMQPKLGPKNKATTSKISSGSPKLVILHEKMCLASLRKEDYPNCMQAIMRLVFFPKSDEEASFFAYTEAEEEISMIMDPESAQLFKSKEFNIRVEEDYWRAVKRYEKLSLEEVGVVHAISYPLSEAGICLLYLSTYCSSFIMVREDKFGESLTILRSKGFDVCVNGA